MDFTGPIFPPSQRPIKDDPKFVRTPSERKIRREREVAGSYKHIIDRKGNLHNNESFVQMIENLGDAYEMAEEMYGMIWWLACMGPNAPAISAAGLVEMARQQYKEGLEMAKQIEDKRLRQ